MSGFPASDLHFLSSALYGICSLPQGTLVLGWEFSAALKSCLDGLPASPRQLTAWLHSMWDRTIWCMEQAWGEATASDKVSRVVGRFPKQPTPSLLSGGWEDAGNLLCCPTPQSPESSHTAHLHGPAAAACSGKPPWLSRPSKHNAKSAEVGSAQRQCPGLGGRWETWGRGSDGGPKNAVWWHAYGDPGSSRAR